MLPLSFLCLWIWTAYWKDVVVFFATQHALCTKVLFCVLKAVIKLFLFWTGARMGGSRGLAAAPEITQTPREEEKGQSAQPLTLLCIFRKITRAQHTVYIYYLKKKTKHYNKANCEHISVKLNSHKRGDRWLIISSAIVVFHRNPNLSDERDLERLLFLPPDEDLERLRFCLLSGEEEGERDLFRGEEPFPDLELDLLEG